MTNTIKKIKPKLLFSTEEIQQAVRNMARELEDVFLPDPITCIPILTSSIPLAADLMREIRLPMSIYPCWACQTPEDSDQSHQIILPDFGDFPKKILLLDTLVDTGSTLQIIAKLLIEEVGISEIITAVLLNKNKVPMDDLFIHSTGFHCPDKTVIGYGLDHDGYFRNLENLCILRGV